TLCVSILFSPLFSLSTSRKRPRHSRFPTLLLTRNKPFALVRHSRRPKPSPTDGFPTRQNPLRQFFHCSNRPLAQGAQTPVPLKTQGQIRGQYHPPPVRRVSATTPLCQPRQHANRRPVPRGG